MKKFMAVYTGSAEARQRWESRFATAQQREAQQKLGVEAWQRWVARHHGAIVDHGAPLGRTKRVGPEGVGDIRNNLAAYVVVQAESHEAAAQLFLDHPHFAIFPGDSVEIMECLALPR
jgi:hypothetical protein